jgi:hypothetical protein
MGRPLNKRWFGTTGTGTGTGLYTGNNVPIRFKLGGTVYEGYILKQVGSSRYKVSTDDGTTAVGRATLTNAVTPASNGDASLVGLYNGQATPIRRLYNRRAHDYLGRHFSWTLSDDSTETLIILTLIS